MYCTQSWSFPGFFDCVFSVTTAAGAIRPLWLAGLMIILFPLAYSRRKTLFSFKETVNFTAFSPYILTEPPETAAKKKLMLRRGGGIRFPAP